MALTKQHSQWKTAQKQSQASSTYLIKTSTHPLLTRTPKYLKAYENDFGETTVCDDWDVGILVNFFLLKCTCTVPEYQFSGRCSRWRCLHASFCVGGGTLLAETMESCLRVILSNSAWTSVKPGFCPWKKWETNSKVISCSLCVYSSIKVNYGGQASEWEVMRSHAKEWRFAATVHSSKNDQVKRGTCSCSHFF